MQPDQKVPVRTLQVQSPSELQELELGWAVDDGPVLEIIISAIGNRREGNGKGGIPGDEFKSAAVGGVDNAETIGVRVTEAGAEIRGESEVGSEVYELGEEEAAVRGEHEEAVKLRGERGGDGGAEAGFVGGEGGSGRGESDGEEGERGGGEGGGVEEAEDGRVAEDHGEEGAGRGRGKVAAAAGEDAEREEMAGFGEEESLELADEAKAVVAGRMAIERREADDLDGGGDGDGDGDGDGVLVLQGFVRVVDGYGREGEEGGLLEGVGGHWGGEG